MRAHREELCATSGIDRRPGGMTSLAETRSVAPLRSRGAEFHSCDVAALFVDLDGFVQLCAAEPPATVLHIVREFRRRIALEITRHGGRLERHFGDGAMATFGSGAGERHEASRGLRAARGILRQIAQWSRARQAQQPPLSVSIGLDWGPVVIGNAGSRRCPDRMPMGDAVNVASRLEKLAHGLGATLVTSERLIGRVVMEGREASAELGALRPLGLRAIRGREAPIALWILPAERESCSSRLPEVAAM